MKETLIAILSCAAIAQASGATVISFGEIGNTSGDYSYITDQFVFNAVGTTHKTLSDGSSFTLTSNGGDFWGSSADGSIAGTWSNTAALQELNAAMGTAFTLADFSAGNNICYTASGNQGSTSSLTLSLTGVSAGDSITMYVTATSHVTSLDNFTVTGIENLTLSYAVNGGDGFTSDASFSSGAGSITMIKITGTLTDSDLVLESTTAKNGWQTVSYITTSVPEPATATLGLLALAGLASRRRRR